MWIHQITKMDLMLTDSERGTFRKAADLLSELNKVANSDSLFNWIIENEIGACHDFEDVASILAILSDENCEYEIFK